MPRRAARTRIPEQACALKKYFCGIEVISTTCHKKHTLAALGDTEFVEHTRAHNAKFRLWFTREIDKLGNAGLRAVPSQANFVLVLFEGKLTAEAAYKGLMDKGYIVRWLPGQGLANGLRITIGTEEETRGVIAALRALVEG